MVVCARHVVAESDNLLGYRRIAVGDVIHRVQSASQQRPWEALTDERGQRRLLSLVLAKRNIQTTLLAAMMRKEHGKRERFNMLSAENSRMMAQEVGDG